MPLPIILDNKRRHERANGQGIANPRVGASWTTDAPFRETANGNKSQHPNPNRTNGADRAQNAAVSRVRRVTYDAYDRT